MDNVVKLPAVERAPVRTLRSASEAFLAGIANANTARAWGPSRNGTVSPDNCHIC